MKGEPAAGGRPVAGFSASAVLMLMPLNANGIVSNRGAGAEDGVGVELEEGVGDGLEDGRGTISMDSPSHV